ncbi:MAG TPA: fused MFS/spermidine synthase [Methylomirabilota bacterium]|nr:fused MFS/spermidine synthase [Methylomirabilota bacterium]
MKKNPAASVSTAPLSSPGLPPGLRRYLYLTAAINGGVIMVVEILGAKMLSPFVGTSHFVWTAQIAVTLVALACGYYAGGALVDRSPRLGRLYGAMLVAAVYLGITIAGCEWVAYQCLKFPLAIGSLLASAALFFVPLSLLAMTGPFLVRVLTRAVEDVGGNVGRLTAISTLGSFLGTVAIGYILIPLLPNSVTMYGCAVVLIALAAGYGFTWGRAQFRPARLALGVVIGLALGYLGVRQEQKVAGAQQELFRGNSNFGLLQVLQAKDSPRRYYLNDYLVQNTYDTERQQSVSMFTYMLHGLAHAYAPRLEDALCIGMGIGIVPRELAREGVRVDAVEINPDVVPLAEKYFDLDVSRVNLTIADGRLFVRQCRKHYDAVLLDAFLGDSNPSHLMTREAFADVRRVLRPDGVLVINTFADLDSRHDFFGASLYKTLTNVFASVRIHAAQHGNTLYVASPDPALTLRHPPDFANVHSAAVAQVREAFNNLREPNLAHGRVLTDDFNPVEVFDAPNRERLRRLLALAMRP